MSFIMNTPVKRRHGVDTSQEDITATDEISCHHKRIKFDQSENNSDVKRWSLDDVSQLLESVRSVLPKHDVSRFAIRMNRIDWSVIAFQDFTAEECKQKFTHIIEKVRRNQTLTELLNAATEMIKLRPNLFKENDIDLPKKPLTTYFHFLADKREKLKADHPELKNVEFVKLLSDKYKNLPEKKKKKYIKMAKASKDEYDRQMLEFRKEHPEFDVKPYSDAPKLPTPYTLFCQRKLKDISETDPDLSADERQSRCKEIWTNLKPKKKIKWIRKAAKVWPQYVEDMEAYMKKNPKFPFRPQHLFTQEEQHLKDKDDGKPEKPPSNGFYLFVQEAKEHTKEHELLNNLREKWKRSTKAERRWYLERAKKAQEEYAAAYDEYCQRVGNVQYIIKRKPSSSSVSDSNDVKTKKKQEDTNQEADSAFMGTQSDVASDSITGESNEDDQDVHSPRQTMITNFISGKSKPNDTKLPKTFPGEPDRPVNNSYLLFCKDLLPTLKDMVTSERMQEVARRWKEVTAEEKQQLQRRVDKQRHKYLKKLEKFKQTLNPDELGRFEKILAARAGKPKQK